MVAVVALEVSVVLLIVSTMPIVVMSEIIVGVEGFVETCGVESCTSGVLVKILGTEPSKLCANVVSRLVRSPLSYNEDSVVEASGLSVIRDWREVPVSVTNDMPMLDIEDWGTISSCKEEDWALPVGDALVTMLPCPACGEAGERLTLATSVVVWLDWIVSTLVVDGKLITNEAVPAPASEEICVPRTGSVPSLVFKTKLETSAVVVCCAMRVEDVDTSTLVDKASDRDI